MEANELRIGNYVFGQSDKMVKEEKGKRSKVYKIQTINHQTGDKFDAIPLTEEWLLRFGFEKHGEWFLKYDYPHSVNVSLVHNKTTIGANEEYEIENMKYFHQIQNLYFALTGSELTIKESVENEK